MQICISSTAERSSVYIIQRSKYMKKKTNNNILSNHISRNLRITVDRGFLFFLKIFFEETSSERCTELIVQSESTKGWMKTKQKLSLYPCKPSLDHWSGQAERESPAGGGCCQNSSLKGVFPSFQGNFTSLYPSVASNNYILAFLVFFLFCIAFIFTFLLGLSFLSFTNCNIIYQQL